VRPNIRCRPRPAVVDGLRTNTVAITAAGGWTIYKWGWQFSGTQDLDEA
jgi:hypothetical protein